MGKQGLLLQKQYERKITLVQSNLIGWKISNSQLECFKIGVAKIYAKISLWDRNQLAAVRSIYGLKSTNV